LKFALVNTIGFVHRPLHGEVPEQAGHEPPQSTPVSVPFRTPSLHVDVAVTLMPTDVVVAPPLSRARAVSEWLAAATGTVQLTL